MNRWYSLLLAVLLSTRLGWAAATLVIDSPMWTDPECKLAEVRLSFPEGLLPLWRKALEQKDSELQRTSADTIAVAQRRGMEGLNTVKDRLIEMAKSPDFDRVVRRSATNALVAMEVRDQAELLAQVAATEGPEVALIVEPALAKWGYGALKDQWLARLDDATTPAIARRLAIECLATTGEKSAEPKLLKIVEDPHADTMLRLASARAIGHLSHGGLVERARALLRDTSPSKLTSRVLGVTLLQGHSDPEAVKLLHEVALDPEPAVAAAALEKLMSIDPKLIIDLADKTLPSKDVKIRRAAAKALVIKADADAVRQLGPLLADVNPSLRSWVAQSLVELAQRPELQLKKGVIDELEKMLASDQWRGVEQAVLMSVQLEHKVVANRMVELMQHPRPEVGVAACFALRKFKLPETLPAMLEHATRQHKLALSAADPPYRHKMAEDQHTQLFQAFADMKYAPAEPLMRKFVPKNFVLPGQSRAAACWALGFLHAGEPDEGLVTQFAGRLADVNSQMPELDEVRRMCAASIGRMKAKSGLPVLQMFADGAGQSDVGQACWWAIEQMTDQKRPVYSVSLKNYLGWFLQPMSQP